MRYDVAYARLAERAIAIGSLDIEAFIELGVSEGMPEAAIRERLLEDLRSNGPIFGKFFRALGDSAEASVTAARRQGQAIGNAEIDDLISLADADNALFDADPEVLDRIEKETQEDVLVTWVAGLVNTCHLCLPLHGKTMTLSEWKELGYTPGQVHPADWKSTCKCMFVPHKQYEQAEEMAPLRRRKLTKEERVAVNRKTARAVTQRDLDKSVEAAKLSMETEVGRRTLRTLGRSRVYAEKQAKGELK